MNNLKSIDKYANDIMNYIIISFDFIRELSPSILIQSDKELKKIQKAKDIVLDDLKEILIYAKVELNEQKKKQ
ncbi:MAG: hypothetical protein AABY22_32665 [Nanoarchaeota archaeon]